MVPKTEISRRISRLKSRLTEQGVDGALFTYPLDVFYFTGTRQNAVLWIPADGKPMLMVKKSLDRAVSESAVDDVRPFPPSKEIPSLFDGRIKKIGFTFDVLPVQHFSFYSGLLAGKEFVDVSPVVRDLRSVKSPWELEQMREGGRMLSDVFSEIPNFLRLGMREIDLAAEIEYRLRMAGSTGRFNMRSFGQEIVGLSVAGRNAAETGCFDGPITGKGLSPAAPYGPSGDRIDKNVPVIVDYAGSYEGYMVDMTRVFVFGDLSSKLTRAFDLSTTIQQRIVENLRPGNVCEQLYETAVGMAEQAGFGSNFMGQARFVGHGVGLELDELPVLARGFKSPLFAGQTVAIEPKFVFPGEGAIGIENTFAVTQSSCERLTGPTDNIVRL